MILPIKLPVHNPTSGYDYHYDHETQFIVPIAVLIIMVGSMIFGKQIIALFIKDPFNLKRAKPNKASLYSAYMHLGAAMLKRDSEDAREKLQYVRNYASRYFPNENDDVNFDFNHALHNAVDLNKVCAWLDMHLNHSQKLQVLYFIGGISVVDGSMNKGETNLLRSICGKLNLTQKDFDSVIAMYTQKRKRTEQKSSSSSSSSSSGYSRKSALKTSYKILGVSEHASMNEIKKAYRKMVKLHHPDRFMDHSEAEREIATERFIEIQKAYETIEEYR